MRKLLPIVCLLLAGPCGAADDKPVDARQLQESTSLNTIGTELLSSQLQTGGVRNAMVSPVSLFYALSILALGADGASEELLTSRLLADSPVRLQDVAPRLAAQLSHDNGTGTNNGVFQLANSLWSTNGASNGQPFVFAGEFLAAAAALYGAGQESLDFMAPGAAQAINDWAREQTRDLIPSIIDDGTLSKLEWAILNTALFEGSWGTPMRRVHADSGYRFVGLDGTRQPAATFMTHDYVSRVVDLDDGSAAFQLPFAGGKYAFVVHLPAADRTDLGQWLTEEAVPGIADMAARVIDSRDPLHQLSVQMPVFSFSDSLTLLGGSVTTRDLGLAPLFEDDADFSRLADREQTAAENRNTKVGIIKQDTRIEVDEKGLRAAAATLIGGVRMATVARPHYPRREIVVDRPFAFAIVERNSQTLLFNGVLVSLTPHTPR
jgi:serpin B